MKRIDKMGTMSAYEIMNLPRIKEVEDMPSSKGKEIKEIDYKAMNSELTDILMREFREKHEGLEPIKDEPVSETPKEVVTLTSKENKEITSLLEKVDANLIENIEAWHKIYQYDSLQLLRGLKEFVAQEKGTQAINLLAIIVKKNQLKDYLFPEFDQLTNLVDRKWTETDISYRVSFLYSMAKMGREKDTTWMLGKIKEMNDVTVYHALDNRAFSNYVWALGQFQKKNKDVVLKSLFDDLETTVVNKFKTEATTGTDLTTVIQSYAITQNGSKEFYSVLSGLVIERKAKLSPQNIAIILYSYANNPFVDADILDDLRQIVIDKMQKCNPKELCNIMRAYKLRAKMDGELELSIMGSFNGRYYTANALDVSYFVSILLGKNSSEIGRRFDKRCMEVLDGLVNRLDGTHLGIIFAKGAFIQKEFPKVYEKLEKRLRKLIDKKDIKPHDAFKVFEVAEELEFEGQYNMLKEKLEAYLNKQKYYKK